MDFESAKTDVDYSLASLPEYAGLYMRGRLASMHERTSYENLNPAPGSADLIEPRNARGQLGVNDTVLEVGPVTADIRESSNLNTWIYAFNSDPQGPVSGGDDYNTGRLLAYEASQIQALTQGESAAAISYAG